MYFFINTSYKEDMYKVCLVTSSLVGPTTNGGVGTAIYYLALELQNSGYEVTILFNGNITIKNSDYWIKSYSEFNIKFVHLQDINGIGNEQVSNHNWWTWRSYYVYLYLKSNKFDIVHFPETCGYAFHTIQAKRTTDLFDSTKIVVTMHSSTEWLNEGMEMWQLEKSEVDRQNLLFIKLNYAERYSCQYCDYLISPSEDMFKWALKKGWKLCQNRIVAFNAYSSSSDMFSIQDVDYNHLIFFGRLEKRKGLDIFCSAIEKLLERKYNIQNSDNLVNNKLKVSFLGKNDLVDGILASDYIVKTLGNKNIEIKIITDYDTFKAIDYIKKTKGICIMSSLMDNSPYSIVECIENSIPFICSKIGGIPELVDERVLFDCNVDSLYQKLLNIEQYDFTDLRHKYNHHEANERLVSIHNDIVRSTNKIFEVINKPFISICIAYRNHSIFIYDLLEQLVKNNYDNYEIIIANDINTEVDYQLTQEKVDTLFAMKNIKVIPHKFKQKGSALNLCAQNSLGDYLLFIDAKDYVDIDIISKLVYAIEKSNCDVISLHAKELNGTGKPSVFNTYRNLRLIPVGQNQELAIFENSYSNNSFIIKKHVFHEVGGFEEVELAGIEWNLMNKINIQNYSIDALPLALYWCRDIDSTLDIGYPEVIDYKAHQFALEPIYNSNKDYLRYFITNWCMGRYYSEIENNTKASKTMTSINSINKETKKNSPVINVNKAEMQMQIETLRNVVKSYENSTCWKITKPLRSFIVKYRNIKSRLRGVTL